MTAEAQVKTLIEGWADAVRRHDFSGILAHHACFSTESGRFPQLAVLASFTYYQQVAFTSRFAQSRRGMVKWTKISSSGMASLKGVFSPVVLKDEADLFDSRCASGAR
jgi:hypothetical protein